MAVEFSALGTAWNEIASGANQAASQPVQPTIDFEGTRWRQVIVNESDVPWNCWVSRSTPSSPVRHETRFQVRRTGPSCWQRPDAGKGVSSDKKYNPVDPQNGLRMLTENITAKAIPGWYPFDEQLSRAEQSLASGDGEIRDREAHHEPFSTDDAYRALDTAERLLRAIGARMPPMGSSAPASTSAGSPLNRRTGAW